MFGVLKGTACALEPGQRMQWTGHLCGVCLALKDRYGPVSRLATNYDAALLSVLYDAQIPQPQAKRLSYCPLRKPTKADVIAADSPGVDYAASMALVMASSKIRDHLDDNEGRLRLARGAATAISGRWMRAARQTTAGLGLDAGIIEHQIRRQAAVEARPGQGFSFYAGPTELAVGAAFGHTAILANRFHNAAILDEMGRMFGRIMVLLDSYQDHAADVRTRRFNALAAAFGGEWEQQASTIFHQAYSALKAGFDQLDLPQPALLGSLLLRQLKRRGHKTLQLCEGLSPGCRAFGGKAAVGGPASLLTSASEQGEEEAQREEDEQEDTAAEQTPRDRGCRAVAPWCFLCDCSGCDCGDCDCGDCSCGDCDCGDCSCCEGDCCNCCDCDCSGC